MQLSETLRLVFIGPGRRFDRPVFELAFELSDEQVEHLSRFRVGEWLTRMGKLHPALRPIDGDETGAESAGACLATLVCLSVLALQKAAGHQVAAWGLVSADDRACRFWFEYEEPETADQAIELTRAAVNCLLAGEPAGPALVQRIDGFLREAPARAMPIEARAIMAAARARGIPVMRMDRPPYDPIRGPFRLRYHGLLRLGHGRGQQTVDGSFAVSRSEPVFGLVRDRAALFQRLASMDVPLPESSPGGWVQSPSRSGRLAEQFGFPVIVRADRRGAGFRHARRCHNREEVTHMATVALESAQRVLVQRHVDGPHFQLLVSGEQLVTSLVLVEDGGRFQWRRFDGLHESIKGLAIDLARSLDVGLLQMTVVTTDPGQPLAQSGGVVVDVDLAPVLSRLLHPDSPLMEQVGAGFVDWLFPEPARSRIPIVAVTGTNGKTTTTRLLARIAEAAGYTAGEAGSEGCRIGADKVSDFEDGHIFGHLAVLDHPAAEFAALESTRAGVGTRGLGFERCDVAVCLNVTADHFEDALRLKNVDELAALKQAILERADRAVVLNADDSHCLAMADVLGERKIGLVSLHQPVDALLGMAGEGGAVGVLEIIDGREWLVLHRHQQRLPLMPAEALPISQGGRARFNLENALHAALAAWMLGIEGTAIVQGLGQLPAGFEGVPGRLSARDDLSFQVYMDYAHNPGGVRALCDFVDRLPVKGRKILCLSCSNANTDELIRATGEAAAGHFDVYICKNFGLMYDRQPEESPGLLKEGLVRGGVDPASIHCVLEEFEAFDAALGMGRADDLVMLIGGKRRRKLWDHVMNFKEAV